MKRYGMVIQLIPEKIEEYKALHREVWPGVLATLSKHHVKNYSIFLKDNLLFGYLEYHGQDYDKDMRELAQDETTQHWWKLTAPCQQPFADRAEGEWWSPMEEVFHME